MAVVSGHTDSSLTDNAERFLPPLDSLDAAPQVIQRHPARQHGREQGVWGMNRIRLRAADVVTVLFDRAIGLAAYTRASTADF